MQESQHPAGTAIIILGPTASGKTALAIRVAEHFHTEIISADSRQCFRELHIGTAKPTTGELALVKHHFIDSHSIRENTDVAVFERESLAAADKIFEHHRHLVVTGGTGLYVKAFCEGIDDMPPVNEPVRQEVRKAFSGKGLHYLQQWINEIDPEFYASTRERSNPVRLMRALEVKLSSGRSILDYRQAVAKTRPFRIVRIGIEWPREELYERINKRVDDMMKAGLLEEVRSLLPFREAQALQTVGYAELFQYLDGKWTLPEAVEKIRQHSRNYAKRQLTWFSKEEGIYWFRHDRLDEVIPFLEKY